MTAIGVIHMREMILQTLEHWFGNAYTLIVLVGSAIPVTEMRATIPLGILVWNMNPWYVMFLGFLGALLPVPLLLLFFEEIMILMHKIPASKKLALWIDEKVQKHLWLQHPRIIHPTYKIEREK